MMSRFDMIMWLGRFHGMLRSLAIVEDNKYIHTVLDEFDAEYNKSLLNSGSKTKEEHNG